MNKIYSKYPKLVGQLVMSILLVVNVYHFFVGEFIGAIVLFNIVMIAISLYVMLVRVKILVFKERVAKSILKISELIMHAEDQEALYQGILDELVANIDGGDAGSLITIASDRSCFFEAVVGFDIDEIRKVPMKYEDTFLYQHLGEATPKSLIVKDASAYNKLHMELDTHRELDRLGVKTLKSTISVPIMIEDKLFGIINVDSKTTSNFKQTDVRLVEHFSTEVTKLIKLYHVYQKTSHMAKYDDLTKTLNRHAFKSHILEKLDQSTLNESLLVYYDLDGLKKINDTRGHDLGDAYLKTFATGIKKYLDEGEMLARFGGDEFVLLFLRDEKALYDMNEAAKKWLSYHLIDDRYCVEFSYGFVSCSEYESLDEMISQADKKMYESKNVK